MSVFLSIKSTPLKMICPPVGSSRRFKQRRNVLFPEPDGPMTQTTSPDFMSAVTPLSAWTSPPKVFTKSCTRIKAPLSFTVSQPPLQHFQKLGKYHNHDKINKRYGNQRHKRVICTASDNIPALCQILQRNITGH